MLNRERNTRSRKDVRFESLMDNGNKFKLAQEILSTSPELGDKQIPIKSRNGNVGSVRHHKTYIDTPERTNLEHLMPLNRTSSSENMVEDEVANVPAINRQIDQIHQDLYQNQINKLDNHIANLIDTVAKLNRLPQRVNIEGFVEALVTALQHGDSLDYHVWHHMC